MFIHVTPFFIASLFYICTVHNSFMKRYLIIIIILSATTAWSQSSKSVSIKKMSWLLGGWENISDQGTYAETWHVKNDSVYLGESYFIRGRDTLSAEYVSLEQRNGTLYYIPVVKDQNDGRPIEFHLTFSNDSLFAFENPMHDFPQKITYELLPDNSLMAVIAGLQNGMIRREEFPLTRKKK